ncbi:uncharacterized protein LOC111371659 isoform X7 [Olea europaea var. sylvestris]|uniref:uncharacterized protein LOC111371659 isoform X7 n=1 Tax=Olea europaea var. sylvestris TaxID=158386 RepID=UPI000C1D3CF9|nr:uncharacterized protein LOC111371659 isoform X7 [Olea europaea var. sylvestris]
MKNKVKFSYFFFLVQGAGESIRPQGEGVSLRRQGAGVSIRPQSAGVSLRRQGAGVSIRPQGAGVSLRRLGAGVSLRRQREMEELCEIARAHYHAGSQKVRDLAHEYFNFMDSDGDGRIDLPEFLAFVRQKGHYRMQNHYFFRELDRDGNGSLDFWEVMTLYYIIKSGRPFCDSCANFVPGIFFSCVECSFTLCCDCYRSTKCDHNHNGRTQFLDNYTMLQAKQYSSQATQINPYTQTYSSHYVHNPNPSPSASTEIVPAYEVKKWNVAFKAFEAAMAIGNIAGTLCTIL